MHAHDAQRKKIHAGMVVCLQVLIACVCSLVLVMWPAVLCIQLLDFPGSPDAMELVISLAKWRIPFD